MLCLLDGVLRASGPPCRCNASRAVESAAVKIGHESDVPRSKEGAPLDLCDCRGVVEGTECRANATSMLM